MATAKFFSQEAGRGLRPHAWMMLRTAGAAQPWNWVLHWAAESGNVIMVRDLLQQRRYFVNSANQWNGWTPLHYACDKGNASLVRVLVTEFCADLCLLDHDGCTPVYYACEKGHLDVVRVLVSEFKSVLQAAWDSDGHTLLMLAVRFGHDNMLRVLLQEYRCPVTDMDWNGWGVLHHACAMGNVSLVKTLIREYKADIFALNHEKNMPLHVATDSGHLELVSSLITTFHCDPSTPGHLGRTPLHIASQNGHIGLVQDLLKYTSPLVVDEYGCTPLHLASEANMLDCVMSLLQANASPLVRNCTGKTPIDLASGSSQRALEKYARDHSDRLTIDYNAFFNQATKEYSGSHHLTRMFVLGYPGAGKSTLIESLKREKSYFWNWRVPESSVPPHTAGIIPSVHCSKQYGNVLFYDFAGDAEYYSSHAAIFENLASSKKGSNIFVVVVDLRDDDATILSTLHYWLAFIRYQNFRELSLVVIGSYLDLSTKHQSKLLGQFCASVADLHRVKHFMLDCRNPKSNEVALFKKQVCQWASKSPKYKISNEARILLKLLERDFGALTACPVQTLLSHIKSSGVWLPERIHQVILELHEVGRLLLLGGSATEDGYVILNVSKLTNEVHQLLFAKTATFHILKSCVTCKPDLQTDSLNIGILSEDVLAKILPPHITKECLIHLQYCQKICPNAFRQIDSNSSKKPLLFFPALCNVDRSQEFWSDSTSTSFSIGWLALCTDPYDYFPPRFLHVLLLRLVYGFTLSVPAQLQTTQHTSPEHSRRCTMWKKGVHWLMEEGVECMVELVDGSKGVVVLLRCSVNPVVEETCASIFMKVVSCVMEAKAEFCHSIKPQFFLLDSSTEADCLNKDHLFAMSDVERALVNPEGKSVIVSVSGRGILELSRLQCMHRLTHWSSLFPIDFSEVLHTLKVIVSGIFDLGLRLGTPSSFLEALDKNFPFDVDRRRRELVRWWMQSSQDPPCWWTLAKSLKDIGRGTLASEIKSNYGADMEMQEKLLSRQYRSRKPDEAFLRSFSGVVASRWPSLAVSLALSEEEISRSKKKTGLSQQEHALCMLKIWSSRDNATYGQLNNKLRTLSLH